MRCAALAMTVAALLSLCPIPTSARDAPASVFDRPLQTRRIALGRNNELRCFTFAHVMVKEIDKAEVGDEQISLLPISQPNGRPPCQMKTLPNETIIPADKWSGYFLGAKGDYVFLSAADGVNRGLAFAIHRGVDPASVFQDSVRLENGKARWQSIAADGDGLRLRYTRVYTAACSVPTDGTACWERIAADTHVPPAPSADCAAGYRQAKQELATARCDIAHRKNAACIRQEMGRMQADDASPSVLGYDVEVLLRPGQTTMRPAGGSLACWPAD